MEEIEILAVLAERLRQLREQNDYTQSDVAKIINYEQVTYSHYEMCRKWISIPSLIKLAKFYNVSTDYLLGLSDKK